MIGLLTSIRDAYRWATKKIDPVDEPEMTELERWLTDQATEARRSAARRQNFLEREMTPKPRREDRHDRME